MAKRAMGGAERPGPDGIVVVDKPAGITSHDVVAACRRIFRTSRVGHGGTLDPAATGVLVLGLGRATRLLRYVVEGTKQYSATLRLGVATTTLDAEGEVCGTWDMSGVTQQDLERCAQGLRGKIMQVPPMVSARKVGGQRLYRLARAGIEVEREAREVLVERLELFGTPDPTLWRMEVTCSAGTYVRVLAADLGACLGGGAHLVSLRREKVGLFGLEQAHGLEELRELGDSAIMAAAAAVSHLPSVVLSTTMAKAVSNGAVLCASELSLDGQGPWAFFDEEGELLALYETRDASSVKPSVVLRAASGSH